MTTNEFETKKKTQQQQQQQTTTSKHIKQTGIEPRTFNITC